MNGARGDIAADERRHTVPVYAQLPFVPIAARGCEIETADGRRILDLYGGHAVAGLGYGHPRLAAAIAEQAQRLTFQSNAVPLELRARAASALAGAAPANLSRVFFVNSGAEANENALRIACTTTGRSKVLALTQGFHGRTAAAAAATWDSAPWYGFPATPFQVDFIPRDDVEAAGSMIGADVAAVIFEPVQGIGGAYDLSPAFVTALRRLTAESGALLIADEVQCGMGRSGRFFACDAYGIEPDILTTAKALGGGMPCAALLLGDGLAEAQRPGTLGSTFGGGPMAAAAIIAVIDSIHGEGLLQNVCERERQVRETCVRGPVSAIQGKGLLLGLRCRRPAKEVHAALLEQDILAGTSADPDVLRLLPPLTLEAQHVERLSAALERC